MKKIRYGRRLIAAAALMTTLGVGTMAIDSAFAAAENRPAGVQNLIEAIADQFDLKVADVEQVFDEQLANAQENGGMPFMGRVRGSNGDDKNLEDRLSGLVENGDLTQEQADKIIEKHDELQADREEMQAAIQEHVDEMKAWAEENDIPEQYVLPRFRQGRGMHGHGAMFQELDPSEN